MNAISDEHLEIITNHYMSISMILWPDVLVELIRRKKRRFGISDELIRDTVKEWIGDGCKVLPPRQKSKHLE